MTLQDLIEELQRLPESAKSATVYTLKPLFGAIPSKEFEHRIACEVRYEGGKVEIRT